MDDLLVRIDPTGPEFLPSLVDGGGVPRWVGCFTRTEGEAHAAARAAQEAILCERARWEAGLDTLAGVARAIDQAADRAVERVRLLEAVEAAAIDLVEVTGLGLGLGRGGGGAAVLARRRLIGAISRSRAAAPARENRTAHGEQCAAADHDPVASARVAFVGLDNLRDRMAGAAIGAIREHEAEWARLGATGGMDARTWAAAVEMRDSYVADLLRAIGGAL